LSAFENYATSMNENVANREFPSDALQISREPKSANLLGRISKLLIRIFKSWSKISYRNKPVRCSLSATPNSKCTEASTINQRRKAR